MERCIWILILFCGLGIGYTQDGGSGASGGSSATIKDTGVQSDQQTGGEKSGMPLKEVMEKIGEHNFRQHLNDLKAEIQAGIDQRMQALANQTGIVYYHGTKAYYPQK